MGSSCTYPGAISFQGDCKGRFLQGYRAWHHCSSPCRNPYRIVITQKKDGRPRRTVDYQYLNTQCKKETHYTGTPLHLALVVPAQSRVTVLDAVDSYHSVPLTRNPSYWQHSSRSGAALCTAGCPKAFWHRGMHTQGGMMTLFVMCPELWRSWMTHCSMMQRLRRLSSIHSTTWSWVRRMELCSTRASSSSVRRM